MDGGQALKGPKESTLQDLQNQNFSGLQNQAKLVITEADLCKHEKNTSIRAYFYNSFSSEGGKRVQNFRGAVNYGVCVSVQMFQIV